MRRVKIGKSAHRFRQVIDIKDGGVFTCGQARATTDALMGIDEELLRLAEAGLAGSGMNGLAQTGLYAVKILRASSGDDAVPAHFDRLRQKEGLRH